MWFDAACGRFCDSPSASPTELMPED